MQLLSCGKKHIYMRAYAAFDRATLSWRLRPNLFLNLHVLAHEYRIGGWELIEVKTPKIGEFKRTRIKWT